MTGPSDDKTKDLDSSSDISSEQPPKSKVQFFFTHSDKDSQFSEASDTDMELETIYNKDDDTVTPSREMSTTNTKVPSTTFGKSSYPETASFSDKPESRSTDFTVQSSLITPNMMLGNQYRIISSCGHGNMGEVWKAYDEVSDRIVAIKMLPASLLRHSTRILQFKKSFQVVHALSHQYICPLYTLGLDTQVGYFLVMKYIPETLATLCKRYRAAEKKMPRSLILKILSQLAQGLDYAHSRGVIHRDIKPNNIAVIEDANNNFESVNLIDFDLSKFMSPQKDEKNLLSRRKTDRPEISGTPAYMSPEQWKGDPQNERTDQYGLAAVAYELFSGHKLFNDTDKKLNQLYKQVLNEKPAIIKDLPQRINNALQRALSKNPEDRFKTCSEFVRAMTPVYRNWQIMLVSSILLVAIVTLTAFQLFSYWHNSNYNYDRFREIYNTQESVINVAKRGVPTTFVLTEPSTDRKPKESSIDNNSKTDNIPPGLTIGKTNLSDFKQSQKGEGWSYSFDPSKREGTLVLTNYHGGPITMSGAHLNIVVSDDSNNTIESLPGKNALTLNDGNLVITGGEKLTGKLSVLLKPNSDEKNSSSNACAIHVMSKQGNLTIERLKSLTIDAHTGQNGILVDKGNLVMKQLSIVTILGGDGQDAVNVGGDLEFSGQKEDIWKFESGLWHQGKLVMFETGKPETECIKPPFQFILSNVEINYCIKDEKILREVLESDLPTNIHHKGILITNNIEITAHEQKGQPSVSVMTIKKNESCVFMSSGFWSITKGKEAMREQPLFTVDGFMEIGSSDGMGTSQLVLDGGAVRIKKEFEESSPDNTNNSTMVIRTQNKKDINITRFEVQNTSLTSLIHVNGTLTIHKGGAVENNVNINSFATREASDVAAKDYAGGIYIERIGKLNLKGGRITFCQGALGGAIYSQGALELQNAHINNNVAVNDNGRFTAEGGGILIRYAKVRITDSFINNNIVLANKSSYSGEDSAKGGGIHLASGSTGTITDSVISGNVSMWAGGGIYNGGRGTASLEIRGNTKIVDNVAFVGGGILMNSKLTCLDGLIAHNMLIDGPGFMIAEGSGVYINPIELAARSVPPMLSIQGNFKIDSDNTIFILSNKIATGVQLPGLAYVPVHVEKPLTDNDQLFMINAGPLVINADKYQYKLVYFPFLTEELGKGLEEQAKKFKFGFLGVPDNTNYQLIPNTDKVQESKTGKTHNAYYLNLKRN